MSYATIDDLRSQLGARPKAPGAEKSYADKMLHPIPDAPVVDRVQFILEHCTGKRVLEFGASGPMHDAIVKVASACLGVDRTASEGVIAFDLDDVSQTELPVFDADVIVCGEVLEHLGNPGWFLTRLRRQYQGKTTILTVPNAFSAIAAKQLAKGVENVNTDHTCWFSFKTLKTLIGRAGYTQCWFGWYHGQPLTAEGLIMVVE